MLSKWELKHNDTTCQTWQGCRNLQGKTVACNNSHCWRVIERASVNDIWRSRETYMDLTLHKWLNKTADSELACINMSCRHWYNAGSLLLIADL
jgi:hypothetical protein